MQRNHCIYCGSEDVILVNDSYLSKRNCQITQCRYCGIMFTELEQRFEAYSTPTDCDVSQEEATLDTANDLIQDGQYNRALELLAQHKYPLKHILTFIIYRDVCQVASALEDQYILGINEDFDCIQASDILMGMLANNLRNMDYYLPDNDEEERFYLLAETANVLEILLFFPFMVVINSPLPRKQRRELVDSILRQRREIMESFISFVEGLPKDDDSQDYLQMAQDFRDDLTNNNKQRDMDIYDHSESLVTIIKSPLAHKGKASLLLLGVLCITIFAGLCYFHPGCKQWVRQAVSVFDTTTWIYIIASVIGLILLKIIPEANIAKNNLLRRELYDRLYKTSDQKTSKL